MHNILITSAGRRVELVQAFKNELATLLPLSSLHAIDMKPNLSAACQVADYSNACPRVTSENYIDFLLDYCIKNNIGLVIPTIDTELLTLANYRDLFQQYNISICISDSNLIENCRDKRKTGIIFQEKNIRYPEIYLKDQLKFPCFAKPYNGSCSIGAKPIQTLENLDDETFNNSDMIFMELIDKSYSEYTIDAYYNRNSQLKCLVPRKRLEVRAGEISKGITCNNFMYNDLIEKLAYLKGARGCLTIQFFVNEDEKKYIGLEINPRFGGGYPLSYAAKANYPLWLIREYLLHKSIDFFQNWEDNLLMLRYDAKILVNDAKK